jgi:hypothetical protein
MENNNNPGEGLPGGAQLTPREPAPNVGGGAPGSAPQPNVEGLTLAELNQLTGREFPTRESALKSIKDTYSFVGQRKEDIEKEILGKLGGTVEKTDSVAKELEEMRKERFFDKNPQYASPEVRELITKLGGNPVEVVESPAFKAVFEKVQGYEESQKLKTVLDSNPRLASSVDKLTQAREMSSKEVSPSEATEKLVTDAVKDAFNL